MQAPVILKIAGRLGRSCPRRSVFIIVITQPVRLIVACPVVGGERGR